MTKNTGVGRGNNPQSHKNTKRGADHCRWNSQQIISSHGYVKVRVGIGHQLADPNGYAYERNSLGAAEGGPARAPCSAAL